MRQSAVSRRAWPVRVVIAGMVVAAMLFVALTLITLSWYGFKSVLLDTAAMSARDKGQVAVQRANRFMEPNNALLHMLVTDPVTTASGFEARMARSHVLAERLADKHLVSALLVGYDNGDYLMIRPLGQREVRARFNAPEGAEYMVLTGWADAEGKYRGEAFFYDAQRTLLLRRFEPDYQMDPRKRPWYESAIEQGPASTVASGPYVFYTTEEIGITISKEVPTGKAVVALDLTLEDLGAGLDSLRMTPNTELALIDTSDRLVGYLDMDALLVGEHGMPNAQVRTLPSLGVEPLVRLLEVGRLNQPVSYSAAGEDWFGVVLPFYGIEGVDLRLLAAAPARELWGDLAHYRRQMILISIALILVFFPFGWRVGSSVGSALERLAEQARPMSYFDFCRRKISRDSRLREVRALNKVMDDVSVAVEAFLSISHALGAEPNIESMLKQVLEHLVRATRCQGGAVYLRDKEDEVLLLVASVGDTGVLAQRRAVPTQGQAQGVMFETADRRWQSEFELCGRKGNLQGLLVMTYEPDDVHVESKFQEFTKRLTGMLAIAIETRELIDAQKQLFEATIRILADAIDAKSPYTGGHCERVPQLATMLADRMVTEDSGPYADFHMDEDERYAFHLGAWLHDCGKVTSPEYIVDKATKLEVIYNRIHEIRMRFEVLWRDADIEYLQACLNDPTAEAAAAARREARRQRLQEDFRFVAQCNIGGEYLAEETIERLRDIGRQTWMRHFDDSLGLSREEERRLQDARPAPVVLPAPEQLLADKPEQVVDWDEHKPPVERDDPRNEFGFDMVLPKHKQNMGELHNLSIRRGTLTAEDRFMVNDHIVQTLIMLKGMPWPQHLKRVPDIAANHHEKMDGTGYPRRLGADDLLLTDRVMALADVFEALTAGDRPYKPLKPLSESLHIMACMGRDRHLDAELLVYFLRSNIWMEYAQQFMRPEQIDEVDIEELVRIAQSGART